ncbi:DUF4398 domain-containing protein [Rubrivirga sp. S365]|uniref:DUF4398 domain-containing protein n=1 Tax=Rubrivirga litoralis TaxID=3075598 RepID=A0ABU3BTE5_9BACT|nr:MULTISPECIES: DUF4398 domain-containing protein [unclassified Rubrivirga]MDT0632436.1 DUF4398 domain-containing protein [Rubrivirga sp. F394]MDT7857085.1 DUF4398 domain-containing protein [Rubrivirga sp. S365]
MPVASPSAALWNRLAWQGLLIGALTVGAGCATSRPAPPPAVNAEPELARAREAIADARAVGAEAEAAVELRAATTRLDEAEQALAGGDAVGASRFAREAFVDGQLAELTVLAARARRARALYDEVRALRAEVDTALAN